MARDTEQLVLQLSADMAQFRNAMLAAAGQADRAAQRVERRFEQMNRKVIGDFQRFNQQVATALATLGVGIAARDVTQLADVWTTVGNRIAVAGVATERLVATQHAVADIASETRSDLDATADLFARMYRSSEDLGASQERVLRVTELVSKALSGAAESERMGAIRQLGQGLGSGRLQGDELRSILENSRPIAEAIAAEFETTVGNLRNLGKQGVLESRRVFEAIERAGADIDAAFARTTLTVAASFTRLRTEAARFIGTNEQTSGSVRALTRLIDSVATNFELLASATIVASTAIGGALAGQAVARAITALTQLTFTAGAARSALAFFGGPLGVLLTIAGGAFAYLATQTNLFASSAQLAARAADSAYTALQFIAGLESVVGSAIATSAEFSGTLKVVADETREVGRLTAEAAGFIDKMGDASADAAGDTDLQTEAERRLADQLRLTNIQRLEASILDQRAVQEGIRRDSFLRSFGSGTNVRPLAPGQESIFGLSNEDQQRMRESQQLVELFSQSLREYRAGQLVDPDEDPDTGRDPIGGDPEARARSLADLQHAAELNLARLRHEEARVRELEDGEEVTKRTRAYEETGLANAEARAVAEREVTDERAAMNAESQRSYDLSVLQDQIDLARIQNNIALADVLSDQYEIQRRTRALVDERALSEEQATALARQFVEARREAQNIERDHALENRDLELQLEAARLRGDERTELAIRRRLELEETIAELRRMGLSEEAAVARAQNEVAALEQADLEGKFREWFTGGVMAAVDGDLGGFFEDWLRDRARAGLEAALNDLADVLFEAFRGVLSGVIQSGSEGLGQAVTAIFTGGAVAGLDTLGKGAEEAAKALGTVLAASAADAASKLALSGTAAAASAAKDAAAAATKGTLIAGEALAAKSAFVLAGALAKAAAAANVFSGQGGSKFGSLLGSAILSGLGSVGGGGFPFGGFRAQGGPMNPGFAYRVHADETIVPNLPSFVIPKNAGGGVTVQYVDKRTINLQGTGAEIADMRRAMAEDLNSRRQHVVAIVNDAITTREIR